jgi:hypothetical protein
LPRGTGTWAFAPTINLPIFTGGENRANLDLAHVEKNIAVAKYELAIQTALREASDALAARGTYRDQLEAQQALASADADAYRLADMRFRAGIDSYLPTLTAQLSLYSARQQLITLRQADLTNEVTLYEALGGGWKRRMEVARNDSDRVIRAAVRRSRRNSVRGSARGRRVRAVFSRGAPRGDGLIVMLRSVWASSESLRTRKRARSAHSLAR